MAENSGNFEKGIVLALCAALVSGVSVFINGVAVALSDPFVYTTFKNLGALCFVGAIALAFTGIRHFRRLSLRQWGMLALIGVVGGSVPFLMFFWGLKLGGAAVSSFIYRSLFLFAGVTGYLILKETPSPRDLAAGFVILAGNALLISGEAAFGLGQALVLGATILWAVEYAISRKIMSDVHPQAVMASRMFFGAIVLLGFLAATGSLGALLTTDTVVLGWLAVTSLLLCGFLFTWYNALKNLPLMKAAAIFTLGGIVTAALNAVFLHTAITLVQAAGLALVLGGVVMAVGAVSLFRSSLKLPQALPWLVE
jgi:drug/metabolite transporter (DMT)-like permease